MLYLIGFVCFVGVLLAGSDGPWFPWPNLAGTLIFAGAVYGASKLRRNI
jgi:hypothetical protein